VGDDGAVDFGGVQAKAFLALHDQMTLGALHSLVPAVLLLLMAPHVPFVMEAGAALGAREPLRQGGVGGVGVLLRHMLGEFGKLLVPLTANTAMEANVAAHGGAVLLPSEN
jgi:hypothetical protein